MGCIVPQSPRSSHTCTSPGASPGSTCTMRGRQQTAPASTCSSSASPQKGQATCVVERGRLRLRFVVATAATIAGVLQAGSIA